MDETRLKWPKLPSKTYAKQASKCRGGKQRKNAYTLAFFVNRAGDKLKPIVIGYHAKPRCFKNPINYDLTRLPVDYYHNDNAWMTRHVFSMIIENIHLDLVNNQESMILILDNFSGHYVDETRYPRIQFDILPPNTTSRTQPLDQGTIYAFKRCYTSRLMDHVFAFYERNSTLKGVDKSFNLYDSLIWVDQAWSEITRETIRNCWRRAGFVRGENDLPIVMFNDEGLEDRFSSYQSFR